MARLLMLMGLLGCAPGPEPCKGAACDDDSAAPHIEDTAAMSYSAEDPEPILTAEGFGQLVGRLLEMGGPNPVDIAYAFLVIMSEGDEDCPASDYNLGQVLGCTSDNGNFYSGIGWYILMEAVTQEDGTDVPISWYHGGDFEILRPTGERVAGGGDLLYETTVGDETSITTFTVAGTWVDESRTDWLGATFSGVYVGELIQDGDDFSFTMDGGVGVEKLDFNFVDLSWDTQGECAGAPTGAIQIRDERGYWYSWELGDDCDACGDVSFHGDQDLGELCMDLTDWGVKLATSSAPR